MIASATKAERVFKPKLEPPAAEPPPLDARTTTERDAQDEDEMLYLIGRPTLKHFLRFVRNNAVEPPDKGALTNEWLAARRVIDGLEKEEAGLADDPPFTTLPVNSKYEPLLIEFLKDPLVRHGFNTVPTEVAFVELDRLVVYQRHIDLTHVRQLESQLGPAPSDEQIFQTCLPYNHPQPPVKWSRTRGDRYVFMSPSNDLRFLGAMPMEATHITNYPPPGNLVGIVGIAVGFGSNFVNAIYAGKRLILNNGSHRAYALREMGITHVPCVVQHVSSIHQLPVVAATEVGEDTDSFVKSGRPPMLKDYFNPQLRTVMRVARRLRQITVRFEIEESYVPAL